MVCDAIFSGQYGFLFIRTVLIAFSPRAEGTAAEVELIFNNTSPVPLPSSDNVVETLVTAVTNPNSTLMDQFNLTVIADSIRVITPTTASPATTTAHVPTTAASTAGKQSEKPTSRATASPPPPPPPPPPSQTPDPIIILEATLVVPFVIAFQDRDSPAFQELQASVVGMCDAIFSSQYGFLFIRTVLIAFSPRAEGTAAEVELIFNNTSPVPLPSSDDVVETLVTAVTNPNSTLMDQFNLTVIADSIRVITSRASTTSVAPSSRSPSPAAPTTTTLTIATTTVISTSTSPVRKSTLNPTTTTNLPAPPPPPLPPAPIVILEVTLVVQYVPALENNQSPQFQELAATVVAVCDVIYRARYGLLFIRTVVVAFRPVRVRMDGTDAEVELVFNDTSSEPLPTNLDVVETLETAVKNPNSTLMNDFNLTVVADSIRVIGVANVSTTPATNVTTAAKPTSKAVTVAPTTTVTPTATVQIEFTSREMFVPELSDQNSEAFKARSKLTMEQIEPVYTSAFSSFIRLIVQSFREGSIVTQAGLVFNSTDPLPSNEQIISTLRDAVTNSQISFDIDPNSILITSAAPSGVSSLTSVFTASSLALVSLLLSHYC
ncbi:hypothetical protein AGOR_G00174110 [Albula goreensis]|uniref:SEA domain-containing protein n=1 Tax=Albula goreensis TaxID=1534307 RepID=A0A8T3D2V7_9TELE|nr:hypothetical protein AGOR_G00174110 [Albula goreensis]